MKTLRTTKSLKDEVSLEGRIEEISMTDLRRNPGDILTQVELGKVFILNRGGLSVAVLSKIPGVQLSAVVHRDASVKWGLDKLLADAEVTK